MRARVEPGAAIIGVSADHFCQNYLNHAGRVLYRVLLHALAHNQSAERRLPGETATNKILVDHSADGTVNPDIEVTTARDYGHINDGVGVGASFAVWDTTRDAVTVTSSNVCIDFVSCAAAYVDVRAMVADKTIVLGTPVRSHLRKRVILEPPQDE